ncbi:MAG: hypothetical protein QNJ14_18360 [Woeseiaceae bacterium]|nr:hypothetical protein [Woeseiaceae bacterium]
MDNAILPIVLYTLGGFACGALAAWFVQAFRHKRAIAEMSRQTHASIAEVSAQRDGFARQGSLSQAKIEKLEAARKRQRQQLKSAIDKAKLLASNVLTLKTEREDTKIKVGKLQTALMSVKRQSADLQQEFEKTREIYKRELLKTLKKRKDLEQEIREARIEQEAFAKLVEEATLEHGSEEDMVVAAQLRLGQLEVLTRNVNKLETENEQLRRDAVRLKQEYEARERDLKEIDELRLHNKQLVRAVEALENSRQEQESEAERFRQQADQSEKLSDTLRLKLDDLQKNFADIEEQQDRAINEARKAAVVPMIRRQR